MQQKGFNHPVAITENGLKHRFSQPNQTFLKHSSTFLDKNAIKAE